MGLYCFSMPFWQATFRIFTVQLIVNIGLLLKNCCLKIKIIQVKELSVFLTFEKED